MDRPIFRDEPLKDEVHEESAAFVPTCSSRPPAAPPAPSTRVFTLRVPRSPGSPEGDLVVKIKSTMTLHDSFSGTGDVVVEAEVEGQPQTAEEYAACIDLIKQHT